MKPDKLTIFELFEKQKRYVVPLFQRPYVWSRERQWEPLWDDIKNQAVAVLARAEPTPHFMGAVVLDQVRSFGRELDTSQIIDGQQRMTTLQVFLAAFRDIAKEIDPSTFAELQSLTQNRNPANLPKAEFKVWPTNADQPQFEGVISAGSIAKIDEMYPVIGKGKKKGRPIMAELYVYFSEAIQDYLKSSEIDGSDLKARLEALYEACRRRLHLVVIELQDREDDPQVIFETLNARGEPLLASDLVRNFLFLLGSRQGKNIQILYDTFWRKFDETPDPTSNKADAKFWKIEESQGRLKRPRVDLFLQHFLSAQLKREINVGKLYQEFKNWWGSESQRPLEQTLEEIGKQSEIFRELLVPDEGSPLGNFSRTLLRLDTSTLYPLMLFLLARKEQVDSDSLDGIYVDLESLLMRRLVCGLTTKNYNQFFLKMVNELSPVKSITRATVQAYLCSFSEDTYRWPSDEEFKKQWTTIPAYTKLRNWRVAIILERIERSMITSRQEGVRFDHELTIEHVMPEEWREHWTAPTGTTGGERSRDLEELRDVLLHSFGNLTLLTQPLNSSVSNGPYEKKRPEITAQSTMLLNAYFQKEPIWSEAQVRSRGEKLFESALAIWPRPKAETPA